MGFPPKFIPEIKLGSVGKVCHEWDGRLQFLSTFPEKLMTKNIEQQKRIQYFTSVPFTPEISIATRGDG